MYFLNSWLFLRDDFEVMDLRRVTKVDAFCHGLLRNMFNYGEIELEQQREEKRVLHFVPNPGRLMAILRDRIGNSPRVPTVAARPL